LSSQQSYPFLQSIHRLDWYQNQLASTAARRDASRPCIDGGAPLIHRSVTRLPGRRSSEFIRWEIRSHSDVPVIITTGHRLYEIDRIVGLELGADDYIVKPFSLRELLACLRAVLRRQEMERVARTRDPEEADIDSRAGNSNGVAEDCSIPMRRRSR